MDDGYNALSILSEDDVVIVFPQKSRILDEISISQMGSAISRVVAETQCPKIIVDFEKVTNMSSSALGMLITIHKKIKECNGALRLCNICGNILEVFKITRLDEIFIMDDSRAESVAKIKMS